jgi:hypothetical protein
MMIQLPSLYIDNTKNMLYNIQEGICCILRSQSQESTVKFGGLFNRESADITYYSPRPSLFSQTVMMNAKLSTIIIYVSTVHFPLHYFSTLLCFFGFCFTSACLTISGCGRSRYKYKALC